MGSLCENTKKEKRPEFSAAKRYPTNPSLSLSLEFSLSLRYHTSFGRPTPPLRDAEKENVAGEEEEEEGVVPFDSSREEGRARERILCV